MEEIIMEKQEVVKYLWAINDRSEVKEFWDILKRRNRQIEEQLTTNFKVGDTVQFKSKKRYGEMIKGKVTQINRKSISVRTEKNKWTVAPSLLTKIEGEK